MHFRIILNKLKNYFWGNCAGGMVLLGELVRGELSGGGGGGGGGGVRVCPGGIVQGEISCSHI